MQRLVAGAKREGAVNIYSSIPLATQTEVTGGFEKKYGIKVNLYRSESTQLLQRAVTESRSGRHTVDVVETAAAEVEAMERERLLQEVKLPVFADLIPGSTKAGRGWIASRLVIFCGAYNKNLIRAADAPKTYEDLLDPKWKGKLGIEAENSNWLMAFAGLRGEQQTVQLFRNIVQRNGASFRRGHTLMVNLIASGEVPLGLNVYQEHVDQAKARGAPIEILYLPPIIAQPIAAAAFRRAPHPHAAVLFLDYLLTDAQPMIAQRHHMIGTNSKVPRPVPAHLDLHILDVAKFVSEQRKWVPLYRQIFSGRG
jgi:iron(III) transport system substrate-binding protein